VIGAQKAINSRNFLKAIDINKLQKIIDRLLEVIHSVIDCRMNFVSLSSIFLGVYYKNVVHCHVLCRICASLRLFASFYVILYFLAATKDNRNKKKTAKSFFVNSWLLKTYFTTI